MDPKIGWFPPETCGPAQRMWLRIWEAQIGLSNMVTINGSNSDKSEDGSTIPPNNGVKLPNGHHINVGHNMLGQPIPQPVKGENKARVYGLGINEKLRLTHLEGCPWLRTSNDPPYGSGVIG